MPVVSAVSAKPAVGRKSFLQNLRDQSANTCKEEGKHPIALTEEKLKMAWNNFSAHLKEQQKNSVVTVFSIAKLEVINDQHFSITVSTGIQQKFIENEKLNLLDFLKNAFCNRNVGFTIKIEEQKGEETHAETTLNSRDKYLRIIEQYPLVKELKDRLKLELDY